MESNAFGNSHLPSQALVVLSEAASGLHEALRGQRPFPTRVKRREQNWSATEKECLRELMHEHIDVIESKSNDLKMIQKKKIAWNAIRMNMLASGFDRDIPRLKQQWMRMKLGAKKAVADLRKATTATGNFITIPTLDEGYLEIQSMLRNEFEEETILIDSDNVIHSPIIVPSSPVLCSPSDYVAVAQDDVAANMPNNVPNRSEELREKLRNLKRTATKTDVMRERQQQISKESVQADELHLMKKEQLRTEHEFLKRQQEQSDELHILKCELLRLQISQQENMND